VASWKRRRRRPTAAAAAAAVIGLSVYHGLLVARGDVDVAVPLITA
jgi:hypothetical protein